MKKLIVVASVFIGLPLAACNTIKGVGEDVESVGETVADEAR
ncbi:MAG: entericidin A/B family lipoprotein [Sphingomonadaceae bacterium]|nr:entericidin A/B family lipoprotein [Sphingomonadaceae bacterium]